MSSIIMYVKYKCYQSFSDKTDFKMQIKVKFPVYS